jgi:DNA-directed RNA polymerase specialized sigma subunit
MKSKEKKKAQLIEQVESDRVLLEAQADRIAKLEEQIRADAELMEIIATTSRERYDQVMEQIDTIEDLETQLKEAEQKIAQLDLDKTRLLSAIDIVRMVTTSHVRIFTNVRPAY